MGVFTAILALVMGLVMAPESSAAPTDRSTINLITTGDATATIYIGRDSTSDGFERYETSLDGGPWQPFEVTPGQDPVFFNDAWIGTLSGLQNGTTYALRVRAVYPGDVPGLESAPQSFTPGLPDAPSITVTPSDQGGGGTITFPVPNSYGSPISNYQTSVTTDFTLDYRDLPYTVSDDGTTVTIQLTGLQNQTTYAINVRAQSGFGYSVDASPTSFTPDVKPNAPRNVRAVVDQQNHDGEARVTFDAPLPNGSSDISSYSVESEPAGGFASCSNTTDPCVVTGLANGTTYTFTVKASNQYGQTSDASAPSNAVVPYAAPLAPQLYVSGVAYNSAVLSFTVNTNGRPATGYQVSINGGTWRNIAPVVSGGRLVTRLSLAANTRYTFVVRAINIAGAGAASNTVAILTNPAALGTPGVTTGTSWAMVSWRRSPNDGATLGYTVYAHPGPATCSTYYRADTACLIGARAGTRYTYTVVARNRTGGAPQSRTSRVVVTAAPRVPSKAPGVIRALSTGNVGKVKAGAKVKVAGAGFLPYSSVTVVAYGKKGHVTGRLVANGRGQIFATVRAPKDKIKKYTFVAFGVTQYGSSKAIGKTLRRK